ncbi:MAG: EF-P lysine aminoacylase EpmA [Pseudomonadales bacterium]
MTNDWQPAASQAALVARAEMLAQLRQFFSSRQILEVETPLLCRGAPTDPHLESISVQEAQGRYLQTSPEFAMKRLLAAGSGPIYQICKSFRGSEISHRHNPEFTMLEWYRPGLSLLQLMAELEALLLSMLGTVEVSYYSYGEIFTRVLGVDPHGASDSELAALGYEVAGRELGSMSRADWLDLLMSQAVEPSLPSGAVFVVDYPACQASLSQLVQDGNGRQVARRFELYLDGMELANGYQELTDAAEQAARFQSDRELRRQYGLADVAADEYLVAALHSGMPECSGVAVGLDRLLMKKLGVASISEVLAFPYDRA